MSLNFIITLLLLIFDEKPMNKNNAILQQNITFILGYRKASTG
jgi:hypothetical protein